MKTIETIGKTVDEALNKALIELGTTKDKVEVDIIDSGSKGLFNFIGAKPVKIKVTVKRNYTDDAIEFLSQVLLKMNIKADIDLKEIDDIVNIDISGNNMGAIIGYRGETLDSLQYLVSLVVNRHNQNQYKRVILDTENYRQKREETLKHVAEKTAYKVRKNHRPFKLEPMNPYERRIIHSALQNYDDINTRSEGEEPFRRIVVELKRK